MFSDNILKITFVFLGPVIMRAGLNGGKKAIDSVLGIEERHIQRSHQTLNDHRYSNQTARLGFSYR